MPKADLDAIEETNRTGYPPPFDGPVSGRWYRRLAPALGLSDFGASLVRLEPGAWSAQRHWHEGEDELLVMIEGEAAMSPGPSRPNGHHLVNESDAPCRFLVVGRHSAQDCHYPDIDLLADGPTDQYLHKDRTPY